MPKAAFTILMLVVLTASGCSTVQVSQDYPTGTDFRNLKTYRIQPVERETTGEPRDPLLKDRIVAAIDQTLSSRGFRREMQENPDFLVDFYYDTRRTLEIDRVGTEVGIGRWGWRHGVFGGIGVGTGGGVYEEEEGVLIVDFLRPATGEVLWRGRGTHDVDEHWERRTKTEKIHELVRKVLAQFPPV